MTTLYVVFEYTLITAAVGLSANYVLRQYASGPHGRAKRWVLSQFGIASAEAVVEKGGCGTGCSSCSGCGTAGSKADSKVSNEQPLTFRPQKH